MLYVNHKAFFISKTINNQINFYVDIILKYDIII